MLCSGSACCFSSCSTSGGRVGIARGDDRVREEAVRGRERVARHGGRGIE